MLSKKPITSGARTKTASIFAGGRWRNFAQAIVNRHRRIRRRSGLSLHWRRLSSGKRWVRQHWLPSPGVMNWQLNLSVNAEIQNFVREHRYALPTRRLENPEFVSAGLALADQPQARLISHHFLMQRLIRTHKLQTQQPMTLVTEHNIHTAIRPVVRENSRVENTLVVKAAPARDRELESNAHVRKPSAVAQMPPTVNLPPRMPEIDISHIADQVMRQLDHRISSWRERRGRS